MRSTTIFLGARRNGHVRLSSSRAWKPHWENCPPSPEKKHSKNKLEQKNSSLFGCTLVMVQCHPPLPKVPMSLAGDPMLAGLLVGVRVEQGVNAGHGKHHIPVCGLLCRLVDDVAFCVSLICGAYVFRFSGEWRDPIPLGSFPTSPQLLWRVATLYVVAHNNEGSASGATRIRLYSLCLPSR